MPDVTDAPIAEVGHGLAPTALPGIPVDPSEEAPELSWPQNIPIYDRMRRTDAQTSAVLRAINLALARLDWTIDPNGADDEVVDLVGEDTSLPIAGDNTDRGRTAIRTRDRFKFGEHLRMANLRLVYGHMFFEQVGRITRDERTPSGMAWRLRKLAPRMPATISHIDVARDGGLEGIRQYPLGAAWHRSNGNGRGWRSGADDHIPIEVGALVAYVNEREGGAWQGQSILRPVYKHWLVKDRILRVLVAADERHGMGVPFVEAPENATDEQIRNYYTDMARKWRAGKDAGGAAPHGTRVHLVGVSGKLPDLIEHIRYQDEQIAVNAMAQFLRLGVTATGSRALGESFMDFFAAAVTAFADDFAEVFTAHVIEDMVDWNYGEEVPAPRLVASPAEADQVLSPDDIAQLVEVGVLPAADPEMRGYVRQRFGLPEPDPNAEPEPGQPPEEGGGGGGVSASSTRNGGRVVVTTRSARGNDPSPATPNGDDGGGLLHIATRTAKRVASAAGTALMRIGGETYEVRAANGDDNDDDIPAGAWRALAAHEEAAAFDVEQAVEDREAALIALMAAFDPVRQTWRDEIVQQVAASDDLDMLLGIDVSRGEGAAIIESALADMAATGTLAALAEAAAQGVDYDADAPAAQRFQNRSVALEGMVAAALLQSARNRASTEGSTGAWRPAAVADAVDEHIDELKFTYDRDQFHGGLSGAYTTGRLDAMEQSPTDAIYYASEIMDKKVCVPCADIDGTRYTSLEQAMHDYPAGLYHNCYGGPRCRGTVVASYE